MPPDLALLLTLISSNNPCLEPVVMVSKVFEPLKYGCFFLADCGDPPTISHGDVHFIFTTEGSVATYSCHDGYNISVGFSFLWCLSNSQWSGDPPSCQAMGMYYTHIVTLQVSFWVFDLLIEYTCHKRRPYTYG